MAHSHGEHRTLTCPECGQAFETEVWLIVDTEERPGLARCIREGNLHQWACPHCGDQGEDDAPILVYCPGEDPPQLVSRAQETSQEGDRERAAALEGQLPEELGNDWQDALGDRAGWGVLVEPPSCVNDLWAYESGKPVWLAQSVYAPAAQVAFGPQDAA